MKLSKFKFNLPEELIAQYPAPHRDDARLMVLNRKNKTIEHAIFKDVAQYFDEGDVMIFNNTKVFPARLYGTKEHSSEKIEVFLLRELNKEQKLWDVLVDPARKIRIGNKLYFGENETLVAEVVDNTTSRGRILRFLYDGDYLEFKSILHSLGHTPLPSTIKRPVEPEDAERYQTIFAKHEGAIAAPTAGLHFTKNVMKKLELVGVEFTEVTLHIGLGNFRKIDVEDLTKHKMDSEEIIVPDNTAEIVNKAKKQGKKVCAVGTTVVKAIESCVTVSGDLKEFNGWTNKFIFPPYDFKVANTMITNFHLPLSVMLMTAAAFAGYDFLMEAYNIAIEEKYRFGTFGDAMLIL